MLPNDELASLQMFSEWQYYYPMTDDLNIAYAMGGVDITDVSQGLRVVLWTLQYITGELYLGKVGDTLTSVASVGSDVVKVALAFDQNMRPCYAWQLDTDECVLRFFDNTVGDYTEVTFEEARSPCLTLDDSRPYANSHSDVILAYLKDDQLCYRQQRDRFLIEYVLEDVSKKHLVRIGLNKQNRLQFMLK